MVYIFSAVVLIMGVITYYITPGLGFALIIAALFFAGAEQFDRSNRDG